MKMGDQRDYAHFDGNNTNKTQFWHARKFRDSTSVLRGGMCEDRRSGYFAGAFMGRKFKNTANREFERSLEYLLDDLSATSGENSCISTPRLESVTPSMGSSSCTSLDTILGRESVDSQGNVRDGFMIDVTISESPHHNRGDQYRPHSDIFDFIQGSSPYLKLPKSGLPITKTRSLCDVSHRYKPTHSKRRITSAKEAKIYEKEFESVLDDLHSTIKDLESFSRERVGESMESLQSATSIDSVSSLTTSEQVSSISDDNFPQSNDLSSNSDDSASKRQNVNHRFRKESNTFSNHRNDISQENQEDDINYSKQYDDVMDVSKYTIKPYENGINEDNDIRDIKGKGYFDDSSKKRNNVIVDYKNKYNENNGYNGCKSAHFQPVVQSSRKTKAKIDYSLCEPATSYDQNNLNSHSNSLAYHKPNKMHKVSHDKTSNKKISDQMAYNAIKRTRHDSQDSHTTSQSIPTSMDRSIDSQSTSTSMDKSIDSQSTSTIMDKSIDSLMSSITDLSVTGSEIGYIADMDEAVLETPKVNGPWFDMNVVNGDKESGVGDCFAPQGFRPLNFVGVESKYMIAPFRGTDLRIPTPQKARKEISTQTEYTDKSEKSEDVINEKENTKKQSISISTQTEGNTDSRFCKCKTNNSRNANVLTNSKNTIGLVDGNKNTSVLPPNKILTSVLLSKTKNNITKLEQQQHLLRVSDNNSSSAEIRKRRISYCSSVDISPMLNGSALCETKELKRAMSVDSLLLCGHNKLKGKIYSPVKRNDRNIHNINEFITTEMNKKILVKRPDILVTVHSLQSSDKDSNYYYNSCQQNAAERSVGKNTDCKDNFISASSSNKITGKNKSKSLPNIHYSKNSIEQPDVKQDKRLRKYASTLIISNVNRYLLTSSNNHQFGVKRTSYIQDIDINSTGSSAHKLSLPSPNRGAECSVTTQNCPLLSSIGLNDATCDKQNLTPLTAARNVMTYTF